MKLRNKKTGEHGDYKVISAGNLIRVHDSASDESWQYDSLASFNEKWEDYAPTEPRIKDEKIRNLILEWSLSFSNIRNKEVKCIQCCGATELVATSNCLARITLPTIPELSHLNDYTITELCGDE